MLNDQIKSVFCFPQKYNLHFFCIFDFAASNLSEPDQPFTGDFFLGFLWKRAFVFFVVFALACGVAVYVLRSSNVNQHYSAGPSQQWACMTV